MVRKVLVLAVACGMVSVSLFAQNAAGRNSSKADALASVPNRALMQRIMDAWATLNPADAAKYYDKSPDDTFFDDAGGLKFAGWQAYEDAMRRVMTDEERVKWTVNDDAVVHRAGNYAWGTATVHTEMNYKNGRHDVMDERWTLIWMKKGRNWLVVHEHFSAAPA